MGIDLDKQARRESDEVLNSLISNVDLSLETITKLGEISKGTDRQRIRLCVHRNTTESVHEMFIVHPKGAYVPPHKHLGKSESMLVLDGETDYFLFGEEGKIEKKISMGDYRSGKSFFFRLQEPLFHSILIRSNTLTFLEITKGPFRRNDTIEAPWAPKQDNSEEVDRFLEELSQWTED